MIFESAKEGVWAEIGSGTIMLYGYIRRTTLTKGFMVEDVPDSRVPVT